MSERPVALVSGANRGIGFEVARQLGRRGYAVELGSRNAAAGERAAQVLRSEGLAATVRPLDVADGASVESAAAVIGAERGRIDVLVNNAGVHYDSFERAVDADMGIVEEALRVNLVGAWRLAQAAIPWMPRDGTGRIVNVSSGIASMSELAGGPPAYAVSKVGLNALTRLLAGDLRRERILVNAVCPGWVATEMGGYGGRPVWDGAAGIVWAATLPDDGPTGGFFRDGRPIPW